jgi:hypothetical protein
MCGGSGLGLDESNGDIDKPSFVTLDGEEPLEFPNVTSISHIFTTYLE